MERKKGRKRKKGEKKRAIYCCSLSKIPDARVYILGGTCAANILIL